MKTCTLLKFKTPFHLSLFNLIFIENKITRTHSSTDFNLMAISRPIAKTLEMFDYTRLNEKKNQNWINHWAKKANYDCIIWKV